MIELDTFEDGEWIKKKFTIFGKRIDAKGRVWLLCRSESRFVMVIENRS